MRRCYLIDSESKSNFTISENTTIKDFEQIRWNYQSELAELRKRYFSKMVKCVNAMDVH